MKTFFYKGLLPGGGPVPLPGPFFFLFSEKKEKKGVTKTYIGLGPRFVSVLLPDTIFRIRLVHLLVLQDPKRHGRKSVLHF